MPDIRYVCLSDLHLGEEDSLWTHLKTASTDTDPTQPSPVMTQWVACLKHLISKNESQEQKPTLILNGDILELALTTTNQAAMVFERFMEWTMPEGDELFNRRMVYLPGNHDHHLWEMARETQYMNYIKTVEPRGHLNIPWHATNMFSKPVTAHFLMHLSQRYNKDIEIATFYPNYGMLGKDGQRCVMIHHGHFTESIYQLMSRVKTELFPNRRRPRHVWDIEAENFAWIDFFWSAMGRSGEVGEDMEWIYEKMRSPERFKDFLSDLVAHLDRKYNLPGWDPLTARMLRTFLHSVVDRMAGLQRYHTDPPPSPSVEKGLKAYMEGPLREQIRGERGRSRSMPTEVTLVFGHTHQPFQKDMTGFEGYPHWVHVYNTGGWVVDTVNPQPLHGGAVILMDEDLNTTSLRMYNEVSDPAEYSVRVEQATHTGEEENPLHHRILGLVKPAETPWKTFSDTVARSVRVRAQNLQEHRVGV